MPVEHMNISLPPKMARFIRGKVKAGDYTNASEVVRDAVRHMQEAETAKKERRTLLAGDANDFEARLAADERKGISGRVRVGVKDLEDGRYEEFDEKGLKQYFASIGERGKKRLASASTKRS